LEKRRRRGDLITAFQYLQGSYKADEGSFFTRGHKDKTVGNRYKLHQKRFHLNAGKKLFYSENNQSLEQPPQGHGRVVICKLIKYETKKIKAM